MNKQQITDKLTDNHRAFADYIFSLSEKDFLVSHNNKWTAGQQFEHILRAVSPLKTVLTLPKIIPRLLFGKSNRKSLDFESLVKSYQGKLAGGSKATKQFIPPAIIFEKRRNLGNNLLKTVGNLSNKIKRFSEIELDDYLLPHPILGKLTIREMLYFTIYHVEHHHNAVLDSFKEDKETKV